jgi:hypothetical protein
MADLARACRSAIVWTRLRRQDPALRRAGFVDLMDVHFGGPIRPSMCTSIGSGSRLKGAYQPIPAQFD